MHFSDMASTFGETRKKFRIAVCVDDCSYAAATLRSDGFVLSYNHFQPSGIKFEGITILVLSARLLIN